MGSSSSTSRGGGSSSTYPASRNRRGHSSAPPTQTLGDVAREQRQSPSRLSYTRSNNHAASASLPRVPPTTRSSLNTNTPTYNGRGRDTRPSASTASSAGSSATDGGAAGSGRNSAVQTNTLSRPGAYSISREGAGPTQVFRVQIPNEVRPGQEFQVSESCVLKLVYSVVENCNFQVTIGYKIETVLCC